MATHNHKNAYPISAAITTFSVATYGLIFTSRISSGSFCGWQKQCRVMISGKQIGSLVRELRRVRKLTQANLAEATSRTEDAISQIERGVNIPNVETLIALSKALEVPVDALLTSGFDEQSSSDQREKIQRAIAVLWSLDDPVLGVALKQLDALATLKR
ncbi:helix-turn-helix transcriptional regulator [Rhizobium sp. PL01]|uniref:helix-turn-helix domain-containing protein n=1 Tax=Rhizobium sp. PL01 TaxID=3085631 RepID=UPI002982AFA8|nr:helix-turn-helix transcriptional regulator [Rhizobium sp. PL01]MDW5316427.1 helix-turn-helix transcriptional regulator [Rhizobium sp. PL01]